MCTTETVTDYQSNVELKQLVSGWM